MELAQTEAAADVRAAAGDMRYAQAEYVLTGGATRSQFLRDRAAFERALAHLKTVITTPAERRATARLTAAYAGFSAIDALVWAAVQRGDRAAATALVQGRGNAVADAITASAADIQVQDRVEAAELMQEFNATISSTRTLSLILAIFAVLAGAVIAVLLIRPVTSRVKDIIDRMSAIEKAFRERLVHGLPALAAGDLTVELTAGTQPISHFDEDELGRIMAKTKEFREGVLTCYDAYNKTTEHLRELISQMTSAAQSVDVASHEMSSTSEEAGRRPERSHTRSATSQRAPRARSRGSRRRAGRRRRWPAPSSRARSEEAAEVATRAREATLHGVEAADQANDAMQADGAAVVEQTREAFLTIGQAVDDMTSRIEQIAATTQQISAGAATMRDGMGDIGQVLEQASERTEHVSAATEEASASTEQIAASAGELASNAEQLNRLIAGFQTRIDTGGSEADVLRWRPSSAASRAGCRPRYTAPSPRPRELRRYAALAAQRGKQQL